jgi:hypothetical protein
LQNLIPLRALAGGRQPLRPKPIQLQFTPEQPGQPARAKLPQPAQVEHEGARLTETGRVFSIEADQPWGCALAHFRLVVKATITA